jgi:hypothetical protein
VYLYSVIVIYCTFQMYLLSLRIVFQRFQETRLELNPEKAPTLSEGGTATREFCASRGINHRPEKLRALSE